jgi:hypothetical protein
MQECDTDAFGRLINSLCASHGKEPTIVLVDTYWNALIDLPIEAVSKAIGVAINSSNYWPSPAKLREFAGTITKPDRALLAWDAARKAIARYGHRRSVNFDDPLINATIRHFGSWTKFCLTDQEELEKWGKKDFLSIYQALERSGVDGEKAGHLSGAGEAENAGETGETTVDQIRTGLPAHRTGLVRGEVRSASPQIEAGAQERLKQLVEKVG